jgi:hypothetical protein
MYGTTHQAEPARIIEEPLRARLERQARIADLARREEEADMAQTASSVQLVIGLTGLEVRSADVTFSRDQVFRIPLPAGFDANHIERMQKDCEMLAGIARKSPERLREFHNAALRNDFQSAIRIGNEIGLREERFYDEGGGMWGWIALAAVVIVIAVAAESDSPPHPSPPPQPPPKPDHIPDAGAPDAGPG